MLKSKALRVIGLTFHPSLVLFFCFILIFDSITNTENTNTRSTVFMNDRREPSREAEVGREGNGDTQAKLRCLGALI